MPIVAIAAYITNAVAAVEIIGGLIIGTLIVVRVVGMIQAHLKMGNKK